MDISPTVFCLLCPALMFVIASGTAVAMAEMLMLLARCMPIERDLCLACSVELGKHLEKLDGPGPL